MEYVVNGNKIVVADGSIVDFSNPKSIIINSTDTSINVGLIKPAFIHNIIKPDIEYGTIASQCRASFTGINQTAIIISEKRDTISKCLYGPDFRMGSIIKPTDKTGYWEVTTKAMKDKDVQLPKNGLFDKLNYGG